MSLITWSVSNLKFGKLILKRNSSRRALLPRYSRYRSFELSRKICSSFEVISSLYEVGQQSIREIIESARAFSGETRREGDKTIDNCQRECFPEFAG